MKKAPVKLRSRLDSMYRPQSEYLRQSGGDKFFLGASFALAALLAIGVLACVLFTALRDRAALLPAAAVNGSDWKVLYGLPPGACGAGAAAAGPACPLTGARPALWASTQTLAGAHPAGAPPAEHDAAAWLGFRLEARSFAAAAKARANIVALGPLRGNCRVWLDKNFAYEGGCPEAGETASLQLPLARLSVAAPLTVAVELLPVAPRGPAGLFRGAPAGLITQDQAAGLRRFSQLWTLARPLALAGMNLALAAMLFLIWLPAPERREYLFLALLAAFHALNQLTQLNLVYLNVPAATLQAAGFAVAMILAFLPAFAGFAFARMGAWTYRRGLPALLLACAGGFLLIRTPQARAAASGAVLLWGTWTAALAGALACLGQAYALRGRPGSPRARMRRLLAYSAALALLGLTVIFEPGGGLQHLPRFFFERTLHIPLIIFLTYLSLEELRETKRLAAQLAGSNLKSYMATVTLRAVCTADARLLATATDASTAIALE
ncbi:MAG TPA: hypothetical protein PKI19_05215, partial [Elusimicrobiales bacterium]|nr:hypothetical protein [Elusimicrobiales bacterium]